MDELLDTIGYVVLMFGTVVGMYAVTHGDVITGLLNRIGTC